MSDLIFIAITLLFFLVSLGLIWICQRMMRQ